MADGNPIPIFIWGIILSGKTWKKIETMKIDPKWLEKSDPKESFVIENLTDTN